jgi:ABC-type branched-subunit amino acid transport system substrate-binding protein
MASSDTEAGNSGADKPTRRSVLKLAGASGVVGVSSISGCTGVLSGGGGSSGPIRLGTAFPYTGPYSEEANTQKQGVDLAVQEINNNGGLMGRDVEVIDRDTELSGDVSARRIQDLIQNEDIDLLCANLSGGISLQTNTQAKENEVPYMAGCQTIPDLHAEGFLYECSYTPYALTVQSQRANARYIFDNLGESMYGLYADYAWGQDSWKHQSAAYENLGGTISGSVTHPLGGSDFSSQMSEIQDSDADVLFIHNLGADQATAINQAREFGLHEEKEIFIGVTTTTVARRAGREQWENIYAGIQYSPDADNSATEEFSAKMEDEYGNPGDSYSAVCYTGVKEFERAINNAESLEPGAITEAINSNPEYQHTKSQERWRDCDNQSIQDWYIVEGKPRSEQSDEWDIFSVEGSRGGTEIIAGCDDPMYSQ